MFESFFYECFIQDRNYNTPLLKVTYICRMQQETILNNRQETTYAFYVVTNVFAPEK